MHPATTPSPSCAALAPRAGDHDCPHLWARDALLPLLFRQLDRFVASLERLFAAWQASKMPPPPPPRPRAGPPRASVISLVLLLSKNGIAFPASDAESATTILAMAAGDIDDATFIAWVRRHATPR